MCWWHLSTMTCIPYLFGELWLWAHFCMILMCTECKALFYTFSSREECHCFRLTVVWADTKLSDIFVWLTTNLWLPDSFPQVTCDTKTNRFIRGSYWPLTTGWIQICLVLTVSFFCPLRFGLLHVNSRMQ